MNWSTRVLFSAFAIILLVVPAAAQFDIYDNGPTNGNTDGWTINFGFAVSDSFAFGSQTPIGGMQFAAWLFPGDTLLNSEVLISDSEFGGTIFFDQVVNFTQSTNCPTNSFGYNVCTETGAFTANLAAGSYWLTLQNAVVNNGDPIYWDENSGPSSGSENSVGTVPSESFTLLGSTTCTGCICQNSVQCPEPAESLLLLVSGGFAVMGFFRTRRGKWF